MRTYLLLAACVFLLAGCTKSNILTPSNIGEPNFDIVEGIELDQDQIKEDVADYFENHEQYDFAQEFELNLDESSKTLTILITVEDETDPMEAADLAAGMIRAYADAVSTQDFSYKASTPDTYGDYFMDYSVRVQVVLVSSADESGRIVDQLIKAGENTPVAPLEK